MRYRASVDNERPVSGTLPCNANACFWPILLKNASPRPDRKFSGLCSVTTRRDSRAHYIEASETLATYASVLAHVCNGLRRVRSRGGEVASSAERVFQQNRPIAVCRAAPAGCLTVCE